MSTRKAFLTQTTLAATGALLAPLLGADTAAAAGPSPSPTAHAHTAAAPMPPAAAGFQLNIMATDWGFPGTLDDYCAKAKAAGYDGIEIWWSLDKARQDAILNAIAKHGLAVGFLCAGSQSNAAEHLATFKDMVDGAAHAAQRPLYINCHSGRDYFTYDENKAFIDYTRKVSADTGIRILHETHRSRMLFSAPVARHFIETIPDLRLTFDVSHWCNVSESLLADQAATVALALERVDHIHARIGHPEGPQVSDPRAPEWAAAVDAHFAWWDVVLRRKKERGEVMTILTEFGPPDYMPTLPYTREPVADQWAINEYMLHTLRKRYA